MSMLCSLPWCRKPIPTKRQCKRFPKDRPSQLAWLDALDAGNWFSIPPETLSTGLLLCESHFDAKGNIKRRYEVPVVESAHSPDNSYSDDTPISPVKQEKEDCGDESDEDPFLDNQEDDPDFECGSSSKRRSSKTKERREIRLNIVHMKEDKGKGGKRKRSSMKVKIQRTADSEPEADDEFFHLSNTGDDNLPDSREKDSSLSTIDADRLTRMTEEAFKTKSKPRGSGQRKSISLLQKMEIIRLIDRGVKQSQIARNMGIKKSTISGFIASRDKIEKAYSGGDSLRRKVRKSAFDDINQALYTWYQKVTSQNLFVNTKVLMTMAENIANELGRTDFRGTQGWLDRFKQRYNIRFSSTPYKRKVKKPKREPTETVTVEGVEKRESNACNESYRSNEEEVEEDERVIEAKGWLKHIWEEFRVKDVKTNELYPERDVFFAEEVGILYRISPKLAFEFRNGTEGLPEFSITDERITVLFCSNADGSEKRKLLVAGGEQVGIPANLPADYVTTSDSSNWITKSIFLRWLIDWNTALQIEGRKVLLLLSLAPIHRFKRKMSHINICYIPMHHVAFLHPAQFGISRGLRARYRRLLLEKFICSGGHTAVTCCDALFLLSTAWNELPARLIKAAFIKSGYFKTIDKLHPDSDMEEFDCTNLLSKAAELGVAIPPSRFSFLDYMSIDDSLYAVECSISGLVEDEADPPIDDNTTTYDSRIGNLAETVSDGVQFVPVPCSLTPADAHNHLQNLRNWAMSRPICPLQVHNALSTLESFILGHI